MIGRITVMAGCAVVAMSGMAAADCAAELAALEDGAFAAAGGGVAKDGSLAPLEEPGEARAGASDADASGAAETGSTVGAPQAAGGDATDGATDSRIAKDGSTAPLEGEPGGAAPDIAMSPQDVEAQQKGGRTAMAAAEEGVTAPAHDAAHDEALHATRDALARGDEAGCMAAVRAVEGL